MYSKGLEAKGTISRSPLPSGFGSRYWGYSVSLDEEPYTVQTPNYNETLKQQNLHSDQLNEEVSSSNIFADTYAKAVGLYKLPKSEVDKEALSHMSDADSLRFDDNNCEESCSRRWEQGSSKLQHRSDYLAANDDSNDDSIPSAPPYNHFEAQQHKFMMASGDGQEVIEDSEDYALRGHSDDEMSWNDSESYEFDANGVPAAADNFCTNARCPGNIGPFFQKFSLPKHKTVPRGPTGSENRRNSCNIPQGSLTHDEQKLLLRRLKNREAAKRCRKKKKEEFKLLLHEQETLLNEVHLLYHEVNHLNEKLSLHQTLISCSYNN